MNCWHITSEWSLSCSFCFAFYVLVQPEDSSAKIGGWKLLSVGLGNVYPQGSPQVHFILITATWFMWCFTRTQNNPKSLWLPCAKGAWKTCSASSKEAGNVSPVLLQFLIFSSHNTDLSCSSLLIFKTRGHQGQELADVIKYINTDVKIWAMDCFLVQGYKLRFIVHSVSLLQSLLEQKEMISCLKGSCVVQDHVLKFCLLFG